MRLAHCRAATATTYDDPMSKKNIKYNTRRKGGNPMLKGKGKGKRFLHVKKSGVQKIIGTKL
jgi:hypothetical protein